MIGMESVQCGVARSVNLNAPIEVETNSSGVFQAIRGVVFPSGDFTFDAIEDDYPYKARIADSA
jgi:hypothetical protein